MSADESRPGAFRSDDHAGGSRANRDRGRSAQSLRFYTIADVAEMLDLSVRTVRRAVARGDLAVHRIGAAVRIAEADLKVFLALHRQD